MVAEEVGLLVGFPADTSSSSFSALTFSFLLSREISGCGPVHMCNMANGADGIP